MQHEFVLRLNVTSDQPECFLVTYVRAAILEALYMTQVENASVGITALGDVASN